MKSSVRNMVRCKISLNSSMQSELFFKKNVSVKV
jgi:hypothetical protein